MRFFKNKRTTLSNFVRRNWILPEYGYVISFINYFTDPSIIFIESFVCFFFNSSIGLDYWTYFFIRSIFDFIIFTHAVD